MPHAQAWNFNPSMGTGNYSATSSNMKLVHRPLLHLVQRRWDWAGPQPAHATPVTAHQSTATVPITVDYSCIMVCCSQCSAVLMCPLKG